MSSTPCPVCGSSEVALNEIDQSECCTECGTVLQECDLATPERFEDEGTIDQQKVYIVANSRVLTLTQPLFHVDSTDSKQ